MTVIPRGNTFQASVHHNTHRYRRSFSTYREAKIWETQAVADLVAGKSPQLADKSKNIPKTLGDLAEYTYRHHWAGTRSEEKTWINAKKVLESIGAGVSIEDIDKITIDEMVRDFKKQGNADSTVNRKLSALSKMLSVGVELGAIDKKPPIKKLKEPPSKIRWFTEKEQKSMIHSLVKLEHPEYAMVVRVLLDTGMRCGELFSLEWSDIQGDLIVLSKTKNSSARSIPMTPTVRDIFVTLAEYASPFSWGNYSRLGKAWLEMKHDLGLTEDSQATPHACRHTFITNLIQEGVNALMVQRLAGHKSMSMTNRYVHLAPTDLISGIQKLANRRIKDTE